MFRLIGMKSQETHAQIAEIQLNGQRSGRPQSAGLYTSEERARRDATGWTLVQGILAPVQFLVFLVSLALVSRALWTGEGHQLATASVVLKTVVLYAIMVTGSIWEKVVFGKWLFAPAFFWEDVVSMGVIALHTAYLVMVFAGYGTQAEQLTVALVAYGTYAINAAQFVYKLRMARLQAERSSPSMPLRGVAA
ncbi:2-vinyl bacteriochlorophyllide hydratase [Fulvimarina sp. 2208YS6-2-32]|uniref:2-vinyl bacteriochlorophyllide hydratase n=1 Tax=Fulvimarina uroteuthidis TaxID=3098149 RepID=A0ABU5HZM0_9HYPH|nr:2-vinyl bacteriochlorophyllide hydratase [Fulvimarina sp. 2208YS6-2-32]MDY8108500.1 2-vinyl bacteriochlorophyllide hydratase [Fulvimarina sp. 2208YS6-2-32]